MSTNAPQSPQSLDSPLSPPPASHAQRTAEAKAAFTASLNSAGASLDSDLQSRARNIHANAKALSKQEVDMQKETKNLAKQNDAMQKVVDKTRNELRTFDNLGEVEAGLERDLMVIEEMLKMVEEGDDFGDDDDEEGELEAEAARYQHESEHDYGHQHQQQQHHDHDQEHEHEQDHEQHHDQEHHHGHQEQVIDKK